MKYEYFDSIWCDNDFYEVPFDRVGLCITPEIETIINETQDYIKSHKWIDDVRISFHHFDLLKNDELPDELPTMSYSQLVIDDYGYSLKIHIEDNNPIQIEAY